MKCIAHIQWLVKRILSFKMQTLIAEFQQGLDELGGLIEELIEELHSLSLDEIQERLEDILDSL